MVGATPVGRSTVGINLTWLVPGVVGGSEEYSVRLLEGLAERADLDVSLRLYARSDFADRYPALGERFGYVIVPGRPSKPKRILLEQTWLAKASKHDDLVHHMGGTIPLRRPRGRKTIVTVHDLQPLELAGNFSLDKRIWLGQMIPRSVAGADLVVCPSRFTAERISALLGTDPGKVRVVPHGYVPQPSPGNDPDSAGEPPMPAVRTRFEGTRFLLYPAIAYRHKRHVDLVPVMAGLPPELDDVQLVLTGGPGPETPRLQAEIERSGLADRIHLLGRVPEPDLTWLYRHALATVFPSAYEGFGNPCLEAMSHGCVVIAAEAAALPEVVGSAGLLAPPGDTAAWVQAVTAVATDSSLADDIRARGRRRAGDFTVTMASDRLLSVYRELLGSRSPQPH